MTANNHKLVVSLLALFVLFVCNQCLDTPDSSQDYPRPSRPYVLEDELQVVQEILSANSMTGVSPYDVVNVDEQGHVTSLDLDNDGLRILPDNLYRLPLLGFLRIESNQLTDLPDLASLSKLELLYLGGNRLCHVSASTKAQLDALQKLKVTPEDWLEKQSCGEDFTRDSLAVKAILDANGLSGVPVASVITRRGDIIRSLKLGLRKLDTLPAAIGELEWLKTLYLGDNQLTSLPDEIGGLRSLAALRLENNRIQSIPASICGIAGLDSLRVEMNRLTTLPECLTAFDSLDLDVDQNGICQNTQTLIDWIFAHADSYWQRNQTCLVPVGYAADSVIVQEMLDGSKSNLKVYEIATIKKGRISKLSMNTYGALELTDNLAKLDSLDTLDIRNSPLTGLPAGIGDFPKLKSLSIYDSKLAGLPAEIGRLRTLETMYIAIGNLTELPPSMGDLSRLREIRLPGNKLTSIPDWIGKLTALEVLEVSQNALTNVDVGINKCVNLKSFSAEFNSLADFVFQPASLTKLEKIHLRSNDLTTLPIWITGFGNRTYMEFAGNALCNPEPSVSAWINANTSVKLERQNCSP